MDAETTKSIVVVLFLKQPIKERLLDEILRDGKPLSSEVEVTEALKAMKINKALGSDGILMRYSKKH